MKEYVIIHYNELKSLLYTTLTVNEIFSQIRRACGFQNLVWKPVQGGNNVPPLVEIGVIWLPKLGVDTFQCPDRQARLDPNTLELNTHNTATEENGIEIFGIIF